MRPPIAFLTASLCAAAAFGQTPAMPQLSRQFHFTRTDGLQSMQEVVNSVRVAGEIERVSIDTAARTLSVSGTAEQISLAEWLFAELDREQPAAATANTASYEFPTPSGNGHVSVFYLANTKTPQALQEVINATRSLLDVQRAMSFNAAKALVVCGTAGQVTAAAWLIDKLDRPPSPAPPAAEEYQPQLPTSGAGIARVFFLPPGTPQDAQELVAMVRAITDVPRVVFTSSSRAVAMRGTPGQGALAEWLIRQVASGSGQAAAGPDSYGAALERGELVRIFFLPESLAPPAAQNLVAGIRAETGMPRVAAYTAGREVAVRGTPGQVAQAEAFLHQKR